MILFKLHKPLYEWRVLPRKSDGSSNGSDLFLRQDILEWLDDHDVGYDTFARQELFDNGDGLNTYLIFYIEIEDPEHAMLFKLTWL